MRIPSIIQSILAVAVVGTVSMASAQPQSPKGPETRPLRGERFMGPGAAARFGPGFERLMEVLTEEQKASLRQAMEGQREKASQLEQKMLRARKELVEASLTQKFDEASIREKAMAAAKLDAELTVIRAKAFSEMKPPLSIEQIEKLKNFQPGRSERSGASPRRRPDIKRDENGLPEKPPAQGNEK